MTDNSIGLEIIHKEWEAALADFSITFMPLTTQRMLISFFEMTYSWHGNGD